MGLSPLKSHKKAHKFQDTPDDTCCCSQQAGSRDIPETSGHFLLHCPNFTNHRNDLFNILNPILQANDVRHFIDDDKFVHLLLYGNEKFKLDVNQSILKATINFIKNTGRFSQV